MRKRETSRYYRSLVRVSSAEITSPRVNAVQLEEITEQLGYSEAGDKMAKGGSASSRADGCAQRGKTKGTMIMNRGGMAC